MSIFGNKDAYLGIDVGAGGIKLVELHKTKGRPQLWTYGIAEETLDIHIPESDKTPEELVHEEDPTKKKKKKDEDLPQIDDPRVDKYAELLKALLKEAKVTTKNATASLPVSYVFHTVVNLPYVEDKEIDHIVKAEIKKMLPQPIEEMQVVHQKIPHPGKEKPKYIKILVTAAPKILVAFYTAIFQKAGLELKELETEAFALERSLVGNDKATAMVVDIGAERTNFFIIDQGLPLTHRSIDVAGDTFDKILMKTLGLAKDDVVQVKMDLSQIQEKVSAEVFRPVLDPIIKEIGYGFELFLGQMGNETKKPEKIILTGGSSVLPFIATEIKAKFPMKVFVGDPWARVVHQESLKMVLDKIGPRMAVAIGLSLRNIV